MNAEIITVGTELITGKTLNTHSAYLSKECYQLGIPVQFHSSVGDDREKMNLLYQQAAERSDLVFICGGLGPTLDDISKEVLAEFLQIPLQQDPELVRILEERFRAHHIPITANNYRQTFVFSGGSIFPNPHGTAVGLVITKDQTTYILLPGPPRELVPMFKNFVSPYLQRHFTEKQVVAISDLSFFGIGESVLEDRIHHIIQSTDGPLVATYIDDTECIVRITSQANSQQQAEDEIDRVKRRILQEVGDYCFAQTSQKLEEVVVDRLQAQHKQVAIAESCTGGLLAHLFTTIPGSSTVFKGGTIVYTDEMKRCFLNISSEEFPETGAVSYDMAQRLAEQALTHFDVDFGLSVTGIAGPQTVEGKPVGLVYIGLATKDTPVRVYRLMLSGSRKHIQMLSAKHALFILQQRMKER